MAPSGRGRGPRAPKSGRLKGWGDGDSDAGDEAHGGGGGDGQAEYEDALREEEKRDRERMQMEDAEQRRFEKEKEVRAWVAQVKRGVCFGMSRCRAPQVGAGGKVTGSF